MSAGSSEPTSKAGRWIGRVKPSARPTGRERRRAGAACPGGWPAAGRSRATAPARADARQPRRILVARPAAGSAASPGSSVPRSRLRGLEQLARDGAAPAARSVPERLPAPPPTVRAVAASSAPTVRCKADDSDTARREPPRRTGRLRRPSAPACPHLDGSGVSALARRTAPGSSAAAGGRLRGASAPACPAPQTAPGLSALGAAAGCGVPAGRRAGWAGRSAWWPAGRRGRGRTARSARAATRSGRGRRCGPRPGRRPPPR